MTARRIAVVAVVASVVSVGAVAIALVTRSGGSDATTSSKSRPVASSTTRSAPSTTTAPTTTTTTAPVTGPLAALRGRVIVVDAGHNGGNGAAGAQISRPVFIGTMSRACDTTGTETNDGYPEHAYNLDVALRLQAVLAAAGAHVVMVRTTDDGVGPCIDERAYIGNRAHAQAGISIHADGGPADGRGFHVNTPANIPGYTDDIYAASGRLGLDLRDAFLATGMPTSTYLGSNGMLERRDFGGLNLSDVPKVLFETGNMRNATDAALLKDPAFHQREAQALAAGFARYFATS